MVTVYRLIDAALTCLGTGYCPHCRRFTWCHLIWNDEQGRFNPACPDCTPDLLGVTCERYYAMLLEEPEEDEGGEISEADEETMTTGQLVYSLIGLALVAALFSLAFTWWGAHNPRIGEPFMIWVATPTVNLVTVGMACLQIRLYKQDQEREGNA